MLMTCHAHDVLAFKQVNHISCIPGELPKDSLPGTDRQTHDQVFKA